MAKVSSRVHLARYVALLHKAEASRKKVGTPTRYIVPTAYVGTADFWDAYAMLNSDTPWLDVKGSGAGILDITPLGLLPWQLATFLEWHTYEDGSIEGLIHGLTGTHDHGSYQWAYLEAGLSREVFEAVYPDLGGYRNGSVFLDFGESARLVDSRDIPPPDARDIDFPNVRLLVWILHNPDLVERREVDVAARKNARARRREGLPAHGPSPVTVVDLRAPAKRAQREVAEAERTYRHRWIVRGHWHTYLVGRGHSERRVNYVMPYVKGPEGAPLNATERVYRW